VNAERGDHLEIAGAAGTTDPQQRARQGSHRHAGERVGERVDHVDIGHDADVRLGKQADRARSTGPGDHCNHSEFGDRDPCSRHPDDGGRDPRSPVGLVRGKDLELEPAQRGDQRAGRQNRFGIGDGDETTRGRAPLRDDGRRVDGRNGAVGRAALLGDCGEEARHRVGVRHRVPRSFHHAWNDCSAGNGRSRESVHAPSPGTRRRQPDDRVPIASTRASRPVNA
jgi:hypothetical protein